MEDFDWVTARACCLPGEAFERLRLQIKKDIDIKNSLLTAQRDAFAMVDNGDSFSVIVPSNPLRKISFHVSGEKIIVSRKGKSIFEASLTLNNEAECRLKINGQEYDFWQVRRMALEDLFFPA
ncbi:MAG: hypothetical protein WBO19_12925 [Terriglobia bacterium]|jgi:hypothetical protein